MISLITGEKVLGALRNLVCILAATLLLLEGGSLEIDFEAAKFVLQDGD
jgi:hypothetical protein